MKWHELKIMFILDKVFHTFDYYCLTNEQKEKFIIDKIKSKQFLDLTPSKKRRRLQTIRCEVKDVESSSQNGNDTDSSTEEVLQNQRDY